MMLLTAFLLLVAGVVSQVKGEAPEQCFYQYIRQPAPSSSELDCNILGAQVKLECGVSGQINSQFSILWHFSQSLDSPSLGEVLTNSSTYTINEDVVNSTLLIILSKLMINGFDEKTVGFYWCSVNSTRDTTLNPSQALNITAPCSQEELTTCTDEARLFRITAGNRCADQRLPTISVVQGGNRESQCNRMITTSLSEPPTTTMKQDTITTTLQPATTFSSTKGETQETTTVEIVHTSKTDSTTLQTVTIGTEKIIKDKQTTVSLPDDNIKSDDTNVSTDNHDGFTSPTPAGGSTLQSTSSVYDDGTTSESSLPVVDMSSSFPMNIIWIIIGAVFVVLLGAIFILVALVVCLQCRKNRIKGSGSPTHNPNAYTSGVRVEEIEANERNTDGLGLQGASTIVTDDAQYEQIPATTNFIQVAGPGVTNPGFESDTSPKTPREHSMQHTLTFVPNYEDVANLTAPGEVPPAVKKHKYETVVTEEVPEYSHLQHSTSSRPTSRTQRRGSNTSGVLTMSTTSSKVPLCGKLSASSGTVHILTEALFDNPDYAMSSVSSSTDQHVNIYRSESPDDRSGEAGHDDEEYSHLNRNTDKRELSTVARNDPRYEKIPVGRVHSLPSSQKRNYDSLEHNHPPPPGYEPINIQTSRDPQNRRNYSSLERNQALPRYEPVEFKAAHVDPTSRQNYSSLERDVAPPGYEPVEFTRTPIDPNQLKNYSCLERNVAPPGYEPVAPKGRHSYSSIDPKHRKVHVTYSLPIVSTHQKYVSENGHLYHVLENADQHKQDQKDEGPQRGREESKGGPMYHVLDDAIASMERTIASLEEGGEKKKKEMAPVYSVVDKDKKHNERSQKDAVYQISEEGKGGCAKDDVTYHVVEGHEP